MILCVVCRLIAVHLNWLSMPFAAGWKCFWSVKMKLTWEVLQQGTVLMDYYQHLKWSPILSSSKVLQQMRKNHLWDQAVSQVLWDWCEELQIRQVMLFRHRLA
ncbi:uncharacterized protein LOC131624922 [Vicia villosa]|uniref:uncharacterized protein LOC131624922 n=1 Tax=Vicia villosa TaxID=3911 RepID=UPI00273C9D14|nr:uncharacterized protein LOC131624922 [Vicia villosa]